MADCKRRYLKLMQCCKTGLLARKQHDNPPEPHARWEVILHARAGTVRVSRSNYRELGEALLGQSPGFGSVRRSKISLWTLSSFDAKQVRGRTGAPIATLANPASSKGAGRDMAHACGLERSEASKSLPMDTCEMAPVCKARSSKSICCAMFHDL